MIPITAKLIRTIFVIILSIATIIFFSLLFAGCTSADSPGIQNLYLIQIRNNRLNDSKHGFVVRVGYFGICNGPPGDLICSNSGHGVGNWSSVNEVSAALRPFVQYGIDVQKQIFFPWIMVIAAGVFFIGLFAEVLRKLSLGKRPLLDKIVISTLSTSIVLMLIVTIGISHARNALVLTTYTLPTTFVVTAGSAAYSLHWLLMGFLTLLLLLGSEDFIRKKAVVA
jgi:hypothetical protein